MLLLAEKSKRSWNTETRLLGLVMALLAMLIQQKLGDPPKTDPAGAGSSEYIFLFYP